jgi:hypothetical protein
MLILLPNYFLTKDLPLLPAEATQGYHQPSLILAITVEAILALKVGAG